MLMDLKCRAGPVCVSVCCVESAMICRPNVPMRKCRWLCNWEWVTSDCKCGQCQLLKYLNGMKANEMRNIKLNMEKEQQMISQRQTTNCFTSSMSINSVGCCRWPPPEKPGAFGWFYEDSIHECTRQKKKNITLAYNPEQTWFRNL